MYCHVMSMIFAYHFKLNISKKTQVNENLETRQKTRQKIFHDTAPLTTYFTLSLH